LRLTSLPERRQVLHVAGEDADLEAADARIANGDVLTAIDQDGETGVLVRHGRVRRSHQLDTAQVEIDVGAANRDDGRSDIGALEAVRAVSQRGVSIDDQAGADHRRALRGWRYCGQRGDRTGRRIAAL